MAEEYEGVGDREHASTTAGQSPVPGEDSAVLGLPSRDTRRRCTIDCPLALNRLPLSLSLLPPSPLPSLLLLLL